MNENLAFHLPPTDPVNDPERTPPPPPRPDDEPPPLPEGDPPSKAPPERALPCNPMQPPRNA